MPCMCKSLRCPKSARLLLRAFRVQVAQGSRGELPMDTRAVGADHRQGAACVDAGARRRTSRREVAVRFPAMGPPVLVPPIARSRALAMPARGLARAQTPRRPRGCGASLSWKLRSRRVGARGARCRHACSSTGTTFLRFPTPPRSACYGALHMHVKPFYLTPRDSTWATNGLALRRA